MNKIVTIFDSDPGIDDAVALNFLKKSNKFDVRLLSSVAGNGELKDTTRNLRGIVNSLDWDVEIAKGMSNTLKGRLPLALGVHGKNGLAGYEFSDDELAPISQISAYSKMSEILEKAEEKVTIIAVGPLTNIALLILARPDLREKIKEITIMGGSMDRGSITSMAETNIYRDPEAAAIVFRSGIDINMASLEVTEKILFTEEMNEKLKNSKEKSNKILGEIIDKSFEILKETRDGKRHLHDVVAVMYHSNPEIFNTERYFVDVELEGNHTRGMTVIDKRPYSKVEKNVNCILGVDNERFIEILFEVLLDE